MNILKFLLFAVLFSVVSFEISAASIGAGGYQSFIIDGNGNLYLWGKRQPTQDNPLPVFVIDSLCMYGITTGDTINTICLDSARIAGTASAFVDENNQIWVRGDNSEKILGIKNSPFMDSFTLLEKPSTLLPNTTIVKIILTNTVTLILDEDGLVWSCPVHHFSRKAGAAYSDENLVRVDGLTEIKDIATRNTHALALDRSGQVFAWGSCNFICQPAMVGKNLDIPVSIPQLSNIQCISVGMYHSLAVDEDGYLWCFGTVTGIEMVRTLEIDHPEKISIDAFVKMAIAGDYCSFVIDDEGGVWAWGNNEAGQLGLKGNPVCIQKLSLPCPIVQIACGPKHTLFLDQDGMVWGCGNNDWHQLGYLAKQVWSPQIIPGLPVISAAYPRSHRIKSGKSPI